MWVWSDELADQFPAVQPRTKRGIPLVAYSVERETDLEAFARKVLLASSQEDRPVSDTGSAMTCER
jgi:hypothetical protein